jgi:large subunit ribosomal protein L11
MGKKLTAIIKLALPAGKATPAPPVGPALGQHGLNIMAFCNEYNGRTKGQDTIVPVEISVFEDRSFSFILKTSPTSVLIRKAANISRGSSEPNRIKVAEITKQQLDEIAQIKLPDLNTNKLDSARKIIEGTAKNMGLTIIE